MVPFHPSRSPPSNPIVQYYVLCIGEASYWKKKKEGLAFSFLILRFSAERGI